MGFKFPDAELGGSQDILWPVLWAILATPGFAPCEEGKGSNSMSQGLIIPLLGFPGFTSSYSFVFPSHSTLLLVICIASVERAEESVREGRCSAVGLTKALLSSHSAIWGGRSWPLQVT